MSDVNIALKTALAAARMTLWHCSDSPSAVKVKSAKVFAFQIVCKSCPHSCSIGAKGSHPDPDLGSKPANVLIARPDAPTTDQQDAEDAYDIED
jgi:hypothetical protein